MYNTLISYLTLIAQETTSDKVYSDENNINMNLLGNNIDKINFDEDNIDHEKLNLIFTKEDFTINPTKIFKISDIFNQDISKEVVALILSDSSNNKIYFIPESKAVYISNKQDIIHIIKNYLHYIFAYFKKNFPNIINITDMLAKKYDDADLEKKIKEKKAVIISKLIAKRNITAVIEKANKDIDDYKAIILKLEEDLERYNKSLTDIVNRARNLEETIILGNNIEDGSKEIESYLKNHYLINDIKITALDRTAQKITIYTNPIRWNKYNIDFIQKAGKNLYSNYPGFKDLILEHVENKVDIMLGTYKIILTVRNGLIQEYSLKPMTETQNPHVRIVCYGTYKEPLKDMLRENNLINVINILLEYLQNVTLGDQGSSELPKYAQVLREGELIYEKGKFIEKQKKGNENPNEPTTPTESVPF